MQKEKRTVFVRPCDKRRKLFLKSHTDRLAVKAGFCRGEYALRLDEALGGVGHGRTVVGEPKSVDSCVAGKGRGLSGGHMAGLFRALDLVVGEHSLAYEQIAVRNGGKDRLRGSGVGDVGYVDAAPRLAEDLKM